MSHSQGDWSVGLGLHMRLSVRVVCVVVFGLYKITRVYRHRADAGGKRKQYNTKNK